ncbi:MAG: ribonuclease HII [Myxococcales bacterium]|nr:ribonuclease HII [Myxococcales bacterium]
MGAVDGWAAARTSGRVIGVDEAGRGPLAGPVVAAAVVLPARLPAALRGLNDSKQLTEAARRQLAATLAALPSVEVGVGTISATRIDQINILEATREAMRLALGRIAHAPEDLVLVDGNLPIPGLPGPQYPLVKGDGRSWAIAAASIIAKETRDQLMRAHDRTWPAYGFARHKGYGTVAHRRALMSHGACPIHRQSFRWQPADD